VYLFNSDEVFKAGIETSNHGEEKLNALKDILGSAERDISFDSDHSI
jgi:hypothetical protein